MKKVKRPSRNEMLAALAEAENALLDYVERLERQGGSMNYGRSVIALIQEIRLRETLA